MDDMVRLSEAEQVRGEIRPDSAHRYTCTEDIWPTKQSQCGGETELAARVLDTGDYV